MFTGAFGKNSCTALSKKHNGHYNWEGGVHKGGFFSSGTGFSITLITASKIKVECSTENATGEFVSPRRAENVSLKFGNCFSSILGKCTSPGAGEGKIVSKTLEGVFGIYKAGASPAGNKAGLELFPVGKTGPFVEYTCGTKTMSVRGAAIFPVRANKALPTLELSAKSGKGKQKPEGFLEEPKALLEVAVEAGPYEPIGLSLPKLSLETEEPLELNTVA